MKSVIFGLCVSLCLVQYTRSSILTAPPHSAIIVAFEDLYDLSLLANTISDQGIDATLIFPGSRVNELYENLIEVEKLPINVNVDGKVSAEKQAIDICKSLWDDDEIAKKIQEIQPTFAIFPALRHDGCLIPWAKLIGSIPVIWIRNTDEEFYVFEVTGAALPVQNAGFLSRLGASLARRTLLCTARDDYVYHALRIVEQYVSDTNYNWEHLYSDVRLILWGRDVVLRSDFASLTQYLVEVGCHHCRGAQPLQAELQKSLIEHRLGSVAVLLDSNYKSLIDELAAMLPQGREGQAVVWKNKDHANSKEELPENLFITSEVDRQDLIGNGRTRVLLSHCADTEVLEAAFHGTPVICFPRNAHESKNAKRIVEFGFARSTDEIRDASAREIANTIFEIHEVGDYRENARKTSLAIRDRINPAVDRLIYWLRYMARAKDASLDLFNPMKPVRTYNEDLAFFFGLFVGSILGVASVFVCIMIRHVVLLKSAQKSKGRYKR